MQPDRSDCDTDLTRATKGDHEARGRLWKRVVVPTRLFADDRLRGKALMGNTATDYAVEAFHLAMGRLKELSLTSPAHLVRWCKAVVRRRLLANARLAEEKKRFVDAKGRPGEGQEVAQPGPATPSSFLQEQESVARLHQWIAELPDCQAKAAQHVWIEGMKIPDAAEALGITEGCLSKRLWTARARLGRLLEEARQAESA